MFILKKIVGVLANPLAIALLISGIAAIFRFRGNIRIAKRLSIFAAVVAYLGSISLVGDALLGPLENRHAPLLAEQIPLTVDYVVVLGSGYSPRDDIPVSSALSQDGLARIVEGVRLIGLLDSAQLVVSGGAYGGGTPAALGYSRLARELGVEDGMIQMLDTPLDTGDEAREVFELIGTEPFILVTSAFHMPRAVKLMQRAGAQPIAAPAGHESLASSNFGIGRLIPDSAGLQKTERAIHEYLGLLALSMGID